jgi:uncharacterized membrane protein (UPF0127 family)
MMRNHNVDTGAAQCAALFVSRVLRLHAFAPLRRLRGRSGLMSRLGQLSALALVFAVVVGGDGGRASAAGCPIHQLSVQTQTGTPQFSVEVADDDQERARGLMFRDAMPESAGMLFVYPKPRSVSFWMKNTLIPLDMIFTDVRGVIVSIHKNAIPHDETPIFGGEAIFSVLELNAGVSKAKNIKVGDVLLHSAYDFYTKAPCGAK